MRNFKKKSCDFTIFPCGRRAAAGGVTGLKTIPEKCGRNSFRFVVSFCLSLFSLEEDLEIHTREIHGPLRYTVLNRNQSYLIFTVNDAIKQ